ncbi:MAG: AMP-binding protein [Gammaproteobacteria bacterium]|jgi:olefin beta-lactone synthetase|nr:AMP-binding protein [Gammaproteobacteria bacterium]
MNSINIASYLPVMAKAQPDTLAVAIQNSSSDYPRYTYGELDQASDLLARGLQEAGIVKGTRTVLMVTPGLEFFALVFALFKIGAVLVAVDPGMGVKNLGKCLQEAEPEAFIGIRKAHVARILKQWAKSTIRINVVVEASKLAGLFMIDMGRLYELGAHSNKAAMNNVEADDKAAILFTSGSTGVPKGVNYTHGNFTAQVKALQSLYDIQAGEIDLATFPLFALFAPAMGMTSIIPDMDFTRPGSVDPVKIYNAINDFKATTMFGSPALLNRVGRWGAENGKRLPTLRRVLSAGAPVSPAIIQRFDQLLEDGVEIFTPYGATESLPVTSIGSREVLLETGKLSGEGRGVCIGKPVEGIEVKIIEISDQAIAGCKDAQFVERNQIGEIIVQGPQVTASYYNRASSNELAKISDDEGGFYHRMGDLGYFDVRGRLWFCGRKSERVVTEARTYYTVCCEGVFNKHSRVYRSALVSISKAGETRPALCVELESDSKHTNHRVLIQELLDIGSAIDHTSTIKDFMIHPAFPVDIRHNAKIGRAELAEWAQQLQV